MIITISGQIGSGKSTVAKLLADQLGWEYFGMGKMRRHAAEAEGLTLQEFNKLGETDRRTDDMVDNFQIELLAVRDNIVVDGRMSWFFMPGSYKIFLTVDPEVGATRIYQDMLNGQRPEELSEGISVADILQINQARIISDTKRYQEFYQVNPYDINYYDLVLNTSLLSAKQVLQQVITNIEPQLKNHV